MPCDGCAKRKLWLMGVAKKVNAKMRTWTSRDPESNAARRVVKRAPTKRDRE